MRLVNIGTQKSIGFEKRIDRETTPKTQGRQTKFQLEIPGKSWKTEFGARIYTCAQKLPKPQNKNGRSDALY